LDLRLSAKYGTIPDYKHSWLVGCDINPEAVLDVSMALDGNTKPQQYKVSTHDAYPRNATWDKDDIASI